MIHPVRAALAALLLLSAAAPAAEPRVALPEGVRAEWAYGPGPALPAAARIVPTKDALWVLARPRILANNRKQALALLFPAQDLAADGQGRFWLCDGRAAGTLDPAPDNSAAALKDALLLPSPAWRLADGGEQGMLAWGPDAEDGRSALIRLRDRRTLLRWPARLSAVADAPGGLVLATPAGLVQVDGAGKPKALPLFQAARSLAWVDGAGLAASTAEGVWLLRDGKPARAFLSAPDTRLAARGSDLYVLLPRQGGVLRLRGLDKLP